MKTRRKYRGLRKTLFILLIVLVTGFLLPQPFRMPVEGATRQSYSQQSFWFYPWGKSVTHKGVDIFAKKGMPVHPATYGLVLFKGKIKTGGNVVLVLGPKWRLHYYAHLDSIQTHLFAAVSGRSTIGTVGTTGNAAGKPPHLHYTIRTLVPYPWQIDKSPQGWRKMFYINPVYCLNKVL